MFHHHHFHHHPFLHHFPIDHMLNILIVHIVLALRPRSLHRVPTGEPLTTIPDPNTLRPHVLDNDLATFTHLRLLHGKLPNLPDPMLMTLHLDVNIVINQLTEILHIAIALEDVFRPETVNSTLHVHTLPRHLHHELPLDDGHLLVLTSLDVPHLVIGTMTCHADLVAARLTELTLPIVKTLLVTHVLENIIALVNQFLTAIGSPIHMTLALIHQAPQVTVRILSVFAAAPGLIKIAPPQDQTLF